MHFGKHLSVAKATKIQASRSTVTNFGHLVRHQKLETDYCMTKSIKEAIPALLHRNKQKLRYFLRLCNVYPQFVDKFSPVASQLD